MSALTRLFPLSLAGVKVSSHPLSQAFFQPNAGQWRLMHFHCTTDCEAPLEKKIKENEKSCADVTACRIHLRSGLANHWCGAEQAFAIQVNGEKIFAGVYFFLVD